MKTLFVIKYFAPIFLLLVSSVSVYSQVEQKSKRVEVSFDLNECTINKKFGDNSENLSILSNLFETISRDTLLSISKVEIQSYASPEGGYHYNRDLTAKRNESLNSYLTDVMQVADSLIEVKPSGIAWDQLRELVISSQMQYWDEVVEVIEGVSEESWAKVNPTDQFMSLVDSRNKHLMDLHGGRPYREMHSKFYPQLRRGSIVTIYFQASIPPIIEEVVEIVEIVEVVEATETPHLQEVEIEDVAKSNPEAEPMLYVEKLPLRFAVKSNLLYDLLITPNIEIEVPIKSRFSVAGEWIFPWWVTSDNGYALQILSGQVEGRYWFSDRERRGQLTGWFAALYAGGGLYDLQWNSNGYQGEFYIAAGVSGGYAHAINKRRNLRMEYSLGFGYLSTNYRYYEGRENNEFLVWQYDGSYRWFGPTKAKVSLVWFVDWQRGGQR